MHWTALVLGGGLALLFLYIRLFVGSSRPDAESQMNSLTGLIIAFTIGVALTAWSTLRIHRLAFEWRGRAIAFTNGKDERVDWSIDDLTAVRRSRLGWFVLTFADASTAKLDVQAR